MHRVFLVDDHEIVRRGIAALLEAHADLTVVGEAATCGDAVIGIAEMLPDVAVLDVHLPDGSGIDLCRQIRQTHPGVRCLMLTAFDDDDALVAAMMGDAAGYLLKELHSDEIVRSVRAVAEGRSLLNPSMIRQVTHRVREAAAEDPRYGSLNMREKQTLALIAEGLTNSQIGERLGLAEKTVKNYVSSLLSKLGLERRTQAAVLEAERAARLGSPGAPPAR
ncbi:response regulator transcription factor [Microbacterium sp. SSW1-49]|uniref:Response regulator transcription factor n=1 Tax=Microbacterium croceum TaxID=2851645 RepID=A0ABT0FFF1_9MICO|nr:response regulator transcription factor [Microbacterium croceum]MCK2036783.1 response regulator transcription factor [Microbacterium croceum]